MEREGTINRLIEIQKPRPKNEREYPTVNGGDIDEWAAILRHREEVCIYLTHVIDLKIYR